MIVWPDADEPRLMSLVPPIHIALVDADTVVPTLYDAITQQKWSAGLPTNALLITGPRRPPTSSRRWPTARTGRRN